MDRKNNASRIDQIKVWTEKIKIWIDRFKVWIEQIKVWIKIVYHGQNKLKHR